MVQKSVSTGMSIIGASILWTIFLPLYPDIVLEMFDNMIGTTLLVLVALTSLAFGSMPGVVTIIAVALTFAERNRRKINKKIIEGVPAYVEPMPVRITDVFVSEDRRPKPTHELVPNEVHPEFTEPNTEEVYFSPKEDATNDFHPVGTSVDEKNPIPVISSNQDVAERFYLQKNLGATVLQGDLESTTNLK